MSYVVITKTVKDINKITSVHYGLPENYPILCKEYSSLEQIKNDPKLSGKEAIYTVEQYNALKVNYNESYRLMKATKPWFKPWFYINWQRRRAKFGGTFDRS